MPKAHITIKNKFQKGGLYQDLLTNIILTDICLKLTGQPNYTITFLNEVNIGRLATLEFKGSISYISFSENNIGGRNASFQSFPSALVSFYKEPNKNKNICFYFLPTIGNYKGKYFIFMYRLMKTAGTLFLNERDHFINTIVPFSTTEDIILNKDSIRGRNKSNNSTYLTISEENIVQIFGKTYGASKYETTLICLALSKITESNIELYEIKEGGLTQLPKQAREVINSLEKISIINSDLTFERKQFEENDSLRSPTYNYNLFEKLGNKKCSLCDCEIPQIIQGAHIWPVASIKNAKNITQNKKLEYATDGQNGLWLCNNHHKLFDINILVIDTDGRLKYKSNIRDIDEVYINATTNTHKIRQDFLTPPFVSYLTKRNNLIDQKLYSFVD